MVGWLRDEGGAQVPLGSAGLLIGRGATCNVVVDDPDISRRHVLVLHADGGTQVIPLGKRAPTVAGHTIDGAVWVKDGDELVIGKARFVFVLPDEAGASIGWAIEVGGRVFPIGRSPFSVGGGKLDDLRLDGWPPQALRLLRVDRGLVAETRGALSVDDRIREAELCPLGPGSTITWNGERLRVIEIGPAAATLDTTLLAVALTLEFVPNGALLRVTTSRDHTAWLPHKRADLVAALLSPTQGQRAGDWIADDTLVERLWGASGGSRAQLNTLIYRARISLSEAGLDGQAMIERAPGGRATRISVSRDVAISIV
jgi:hypothetical protein